MATSMSIERDPNRVYYRAGGFEQSRPILQGPDAKETFEFIPTVNMANILSPDLELRKKLAAEVGQAMREVGFFYAINPPVDNKLMGTLLSKVVLY
jgi:non-haem dioxygenase in morphine synthesis N-terminal